MQVKAKEQLLYARWFSRQKQGWSFFKKNHGNKLNMPAAGAEDSIISNGTVCIRYQIYSYKGQEVQVLALGASRRSETVRG